MLSMLLPKLKRGDVVVMDNLRAHHDPRVEPACTARGVRVIYLPPYSPDFNPIESGWALQKQYVRRIAPRHCPSPRRSSCAPPCHPEALSQLVCSLRLSSSTQLIPGVSEGRRLAIRNTHAGTAEGCTAVTRVLWLAQLPCEVEIDVSTLGALARKHRHADRTLCEFRERLILIGCRPRWKERSISYRAARQWVR